MEWSGCCFSYNERKRPDFMYQKGKNRILAKWFYLFLGSFLLGVLIMNMGKEVFLTEEGIFAPSGINRLKYLEVDGGRFFQYVFKKRMLEVIFPILLSTTGIGYLAIYGCVVWQGTLMGMTITAAMIRFGLKGMLLILAGTFPHQFLLFPAMVMLLVWCYENCGHKFLDVRNKKRQMMRQAGTLLWILFVVLISCTLESYVNPILVSDMLKIF